tara:strand:- start:193 stop:474 length:282 start_codon:yes stop_codon:yes gene_type:complete
MKYFKNIFLLSFSFLFLNQILFDITFAGINYNSIIKTFCLIDFKEKMLKANKKYNNNLGEQVCNCYLNNISKNNSHEESIYKCKLENIQNINS